MLEIDRTINEIDQAEVCHAKLLKIGADHKRRGIKDIFFMVCSWYEQQIKCVPH
jgi:hypothetical protein